MNHFIGIDVAKATLQVYIPQDEIDLEFSNTKSGLNKLYKTLKVNYKESLQELVFVYESTGCYSRPLEEFCQKMGINCFKVGAYQSASFSKTIKNRNKTDKVDARMLSAMQILAGKGDIKVPYRDEDAHQLRSYIKYYQSLNKEKTRQKNYLEAAEINQEDDYILKQVKKRIRQINKEQENLMALSMKLIKANSDYLKAYENIISIKGLDPVQKESGTSLKSKTRISKQEISLVRGLLYMPILSTVQHNNEMKHFYECLIKSGKVKMSAQIAVMRKVILLAYSLYKNNERYDENKYLTFI